MEIFAGIALVCAILYIFFPLLTYRCSKAWYRGRELILKPTKTKTHE